jgi:hypothetical protein
LQRQKRERKTDNQTADHLVAPSNLAEWDIEASLLSANIAPSLGDRSSVCDRHFGRPANVSYWNVSIFTAHPAAPPAAG